MRSHPQRDRLARELHARPFIALDAPVRLLHLALLRDEHEPDGAEHARLAELCREHGVDAPAADVIHFTTTLGDTGLKWERHAEFTTWTVWRHGSAGEPFAGRAGDELRAPWLDSLPGQLLVAVRAAVLGAADPTPSPATLAACFDPLSVCAAGLGDGDTQVWTDFHPDADGMTRLLLHDRSGNARQLGRRLQRLLEIETYRTMALLGLPVAQAAAPRIAAVESRLAKVTERLEILEDLDAEQATLANLMKLSAESEEIASDTAYRFSASRAYFDIVHERLQRLAESRLGDLPTIGGFMDRRLSPAMRTCEATRARQDTLSGRIARTAELLRTRVELAIESQNRDLLLSMERRARLQLRLQQTVEGLSVAAITYYVVGLVSYLGKGAAAAGIAVNETVLTGLAVPVVALLIWSGVRRFRRRIESEDDRGQDP